MEYVTRQFLISSVVPLRHDQLASVEEFMMHPSRRALAAAALTLLTGITASCAGGGTDNTEWNGTPRMVLQPGLNLAAVPDTIILNPNDSNAARDSVTHKLIGSSVLSAIFLGADMKPIVGAPVTFSTTAGMLASNKAAVITDSTGLAPDTLWVTEDDSSEITVLATSGTESKPVTVFIDIAPTANAGPDQTVECGTRVTLNGSGSTDPNSSAGTNDDITSYKWYVGDSIIAEGAVAQVSCPVGTTVITLQVTDKAGAMDTDEVAVTVVDTTPPVVTLRMSPDRIWPPNHKMKTVQAILNIQDCDPAPTVQLVSVTSNEPDNGLGDGDTSNDISGASLGTDDRSVQVRAERAGGGSGRVYTFVYRVTDASGNSTQVSANVAVPHDMGH